MEKPTLNSKRKTMKGVFKPTNPQKYKGNPDNIVYRSQWEFKFMMDLDHDPNVIQWSSEEIVIPYRIPQDRTKRIRRYFPDFWVLKRTPKGYEEFLIEIKPYSQVMRPVKGKKQRKTYLNECQTYAMNKSKWTAARKWCEERNMQFVIITEKTLFGKN